MLMTILLQVAGTGVLTKGIVAIAAALVVLGGAFGLSKIGQTALDAIARQPQSSGDIRSSMVIVAAFLEGIALFAVVICFLALS